MKYTINSPQGMVDFGRTLKEIGNKFLVHGILGAGKTHLCKGFAEALGIEPGQVHSPTYVYYHEYDHKLFHGDFYRINDPHILALRGISDTMEEYNYCFIEWPNFAEHYADSSWHVITIDYDTTHPDQRTVEIKSYKP